MFQMKRLAVLPIALMAAISVNALEITEDQDSAFSCRG
jgi:hypothetical protein